MNNPYIQSSIAVIWNSSVYSCFNVTSYEPISSSFSHNSICWLLLRCFNSSSACSKCDQASCLCVWKPFRIRHEERWALFNAPLSFTDLITWRCQVWNWTYQMAPGLHAEMNVFFINLSVIGSKFFQLYWPKSGMSERFAPADSLSIFSLVCNFTCWCSKLSPFTRRRHGVTDQSSVNFIVFTLVTRLLAHVSSYVHLYGELSHAIEQKTTKRAGEEGWYWMKRIYFTLYVIPSTQSIKAG